MSDLKNKLINHVNFSKPNEFEAKDLASDLASNDQYADWVAKGRPNMNPHKWAHRLGAYGMHSVVGGTAGSLASCVVGPLAAPVAPLIGYAGWKVWGRKDVNPQGYYAFNDNTLINKSTCMNPTTPGFTREQTRKKYPNASRILKGSNLIVNFPEAFGDTTGVNTYGFSEAEDIKLDNKIHDIPKEVYNPNNNTWGTKGAWGTGGMTLLGNTLGTLGGTAVGGAAGGALGAGVGAILGNSETAVGLGTLAAPIGAGIGAIGGSIYGSIKGYKYGKRNFMRMDVEFDKFYAFSSVEPTHASCLNEFSPKSTREECKIAYPNAARILKGSTLYAMYPNEFSAS